LLETISEDDFAADFGGEFHFGGSEVQVRGQYRKIFREVAADFGECHFVAKDVIKARFALVQGDTQMQGRVRLGV
jgi:hypothetical protein